ncbi:DUF2778 domain-containing protein [Erwinia tracheiphila]|uniref:DUF2778 domain-containing protein n=1 Tax=Erwinia tracheiphila TaxID=65700 RepID=UPI001E56F36C|nr:DUF2778 domain-containing protein [Erwinia tracheiphila]UIA90128.1 DUF2778 domain-containing protein [Erwinia tracheiphila]UIA98653.1 DUF2778 domain-containing protein [Erwinia tracheiphila]
MPKAEPLPPGRYHIVDRPTGGWKVVIRTDLHDFVTRLAYARFPSGQITNSQAG